MWSLATEWQIYLLFPALVAIWRRRTIGAVVINAMRITLLLQVLLMIGAAPGSNPWPPQFLTLFAFGMAGATANFPRAKEEDPGRRVRWGSLAAGLFALFVVLQFTVGGWLRDSGHQQVEDFLVGGAVASLVIYCGRARIDGVDPPILRMLEANLLVNLGRFSYSLYLIHAPILAALYLGFQSLGLPCAIVQVAMLGLGIPLSVLAAFVFYLAFERPFLHERPTTVGADPRGCNSLLRSPSCVIGADPL